MTAWHVPGTMLSHLHAFFASHNLTLRKRKLNLTEAEELSKTTQEDMVAWALEAVVSASESELPPAHLQPLKDSL